MRLLHARSKQTLVDTTSSSIACYVLENASGFKFRRSANVYKDTLSISVEVDPSYNFADFNQKLGFTTMVCQEVVLSNSFSCGLSGVDGLVLKCHNDNRGTFTEFYRAEWFPGHKPVEQYQLLTFNSNVMRGMKVHAIHHDYFCPVAGRFILGLKDMRLSSETYKKTATIPMDSTSPVLIHIPPGIAHGFYSEVPCSLLTGVSHYWNTEDELSICWDDPNINIDWGIDSQPILSSADGDCLPYDQVEKSLNSLLQ